jgi:large subunit ribosomal protein L10
MPSLVNRLVVRELEQQLEGAKGMLFLSFGGLTVKEVESLRGKMAEKGIQVRLLRNSLARRVLTERGLPFDDTVLFGNTALAWGETEAAIHAAKVVSEPDFRKLGKVKIRAGVLEGAWLAEKDAAALADVPDRKTLQGMILGCLSASARGLAAALQALPSGLARVVDARAAKLPAGADGGETPAEPAPSPETPA